MVERKISAGLVPPCDYLPPAREVFFTLTPHEETEILGIIMKRKDPEEIDNWRGVRERTAAFL
jgi:hypothetical protein